MKVEITNPELLKTVLTQVKGSDVHSLWAKAKLYSTAGKVHIQHFNTDFDLRDFCVGKASGDFEYIIQSKELLKAVSDFKKTYSFNVDTDDNFAKFEMQDGLTVRLIDSLKQDNFTWPESIMSGAEKLVRFDKDSFFEMLETVMDASNKDDNRYIYNGFCIGENNIVATDGRRLHKIDHSEKFNANVIESIVLHYEFYKELLKYKKLIKDYIDISYNADNRFVLIQSDNIVFKTIPLEGRFPEWQKVIPNVKEKTVITFNDTKKLIKKVEKLKKFAEAPSYQVILELTHENLKPTTVRMRTFIPDHSNVEQDLTLDILVLHDDIGIEKIACNAVYLLDALKRIKGDIVDLTVYEANKPIVITETPVKQNGIVVSQDSGYMALVMPMKP